MRRADSLRGKFTDLPRFGRKVLYVAELTNGVVKVGMTGNASARVFGIAYEARRIFGAVTVARFGVTGASFRMRYDMQRAEDRALVQIAKVAEFATEKNGEYFTGITYEEAVQIVDESAADILGLVTDEQGLSTHAPMVFRSPAKSFAKTDESDFLSRKVSEGLASWKT